MIIKKKDSKLINTGSFILIVCVILSSCSRFQHVLKKGNAEEKYEAGIMYYDKGDYFHAIQLFEELVPIMRGKKEGELVEFYLAKSYYEQGDYILGAESFKNFYELYGRSDYAEEALFLYAKSIYKASPRYDLDPTSTREAIYAIQGFLNNHPSSKFKEESEKMLSELRAKLERKDFEQAKLYYHLENYTSAITAFSNFENDFPDSSMKEEALFLKLEAAYLLAKNSIDSKKKERFQRVITCYESLLDHYPKSVFLKKAENYYEESLRLLPVYSKSN